MRFQGATLSLLAAGLTLAAGQCQAGEVDFRASGKVDAQLRVYENPGQYAGQQYRSAWSVAAEPELYWQWDRGDSSVVFKPFYRYDQRDGERTHGDIRELLWVTVGDGWELRSGIGKVFWGVTEFQHLVDVINQTDGVESFDGEQKLGQPMVNLSVVRDWGIVDAFVLPGFRERTFAGGDGRLRGPVAVDWDKARYESSAGDKHVDLALRWSHSIDVLDFGVHWFKGTNRDPLVQIEQGENQPRWLPYYQQMTQFGVDMQVTIDAWLWKFEALSRRSQGQTYTAAQAGLEYTFYGIADSAADVGVLLEYGWDDRHKSATSSGQNDLFVGARLVMNDASSTELLVGGGYDLDYHTRSLVIEGSHRIGDSLKLVVDARLFGVNHSQDPARVLRRDNYAQLSLEYYY